MEFDHFVGALAAWTGLAPRAYEPSVDGRQLTTRGAAHLASGRFRPEHVDEQVRKTPACPERTRPSTGSGRASRRTAPRVVRTANRALERGRSTPASTRAEPFNRCATMGSPRSVSE